MKKAIKMLPIIVFASIAITSCKKDEVTPEQNDNEVITTVQVEFNEVGTSNTLTYKWEDLDGPGGSNPVIDNILLAPEKVYAAEILVLDKTKNPVDTTSNEIREEDADHRFYFTPSGVNITVSNPDNDLNGIPVGLINTWTTGAASTGTITITLRHYENGGKAAADGVNDSKSSTDIEVQFNAAIQ